MARPDIRTETYIFSVRSLHANDDTQRNAYDRSRRRHHQHPHPPYLLPLFDYHLYHPISREVEGCEKKEREREMGPATEKAPTHDKNKVD